METCRSRNSVQTIRLEDYGIVWASTVEITHPVSRNEPLRLINSGEYEWVASALIVRKARPNL